MFCLLEKAEHYDNVMVGSYYGLLKLVNSMQGNDNIIIHYKPWLHCLNKYGIIGRKFHPWTD